MFARLRIVIVVITFYSCHPKHDKFTVWQAPDTLKIPATDEGRLIRYGRDLIAHTSRYLGPKGAIARISNGMNCQNCHLEAGTKPWGNNYSAVTSTYPKFRDRSASMENIFRRVNDCIQRSLNGQPLDTNSREMKAITAYMTWLGQEVPRGIKPTGAGITDLPFLDRPADSGKGRTIYLQQCQRCHGPQGEGVSDADSTGYVYPPLWGEHSYTTAAGLYRISRLAGYAKDNMPFGCSYQTRLLTDAQAWDVAAFINSQPRPGITFDKDWPNISKKPFDHPFGPYADSFTSRQHKYGPFGPMIRHH
jgi:thiosulfate dehydrogenase